MCVVPPSPRLALALSLAPCLTLTSTHLDSSPPGLTYLPDLLALDTRLWALQRRDNADPALARAPAPSHSTPARDALAPGRRGEAYRGRCHVPPPSTGHRGGSRVARFARERVETLWLVKEVRELPSSLSLSLSLARAWSAPH